MITSTYGFLRTLCVLFEHGMDLRGRLWMSWIEPWVRILLFLKIRFCYPAFIFVRFESIFDRNADRLQQTNTDVDKQEPALGATERIAMDSQCYVPPRHSSLFYIHQCPFQVQKAPLTTTEIHQNPLLFSNWGTIVAITSNSLYELLGIISSKTPICPRISSAFRPT